jgi:hypothetical protein
VLDIFLFVLSLLAVAVILFLVVFVAWMIWSTGVAHRLEFIPHWYNVPLFFINMWYRFTGKIDEGNCLGFILDGFGSGLRIWDSNWEVFFSRPLLSDGRDLKTGDIIIYLNKKGDMVHVGKLFESRKGKFSIISKLGKGGYYALCTNSILKLKFDATKVKLVVLRDNWNLGVGSSRYLENRDIFNKIKSKIGRV